MIVRINIPSIESNELQKEINSEEILRSKIIKIFTENKNKSRQVKTRGGEQEITIALITGGFTVIVALINLISAYINKKESLKDKPREFIIKNSRTNSLIIIPQNSKRIDIDTKLKDFPVKENDDISLTLR